MKNLTTKQLARITGIFYLLIIICGLYSGMAVRASLVDFTDPAGTIQNIIQQSGLYRVGFLSDLVMVICDVVVSILFFLLLKKVDLIIAIFATAFRLIQSAVLGANLINLFSPLIYLEEFSTISAIQQEVITTSVMQQLQVFEYGYLISGVFFAFNCLLMGYLLYKSALFPKFWGIFLAFAGLSYLINSITYFTFPEAASYTQLLVVVSAIFAELGLCLYLLIKGVRTDGNMPINE